MHRQTDQGRRSQRPSPSPRATAANAAHKPKTAAEAHKEQLDQLFKDPSKDVYIPKAPQAKTLAPARDMIPNVQGSSAGAGSGEFHVYKQSRRREYERLKIMDEEEKKEQAAAEYKQRQEALKEADEQRVSKNRAKRLKKKAKRDQKGKSKAAGATNNGKSRGKTGDDASSSDDSDSDDDDGESRQRKRKLAQGAPGSIVFRGTDERAADDHQPREEEVIIKRVEQAVPQDANESQPAAIPAGINIVDDD